MMAYSQPSYYYDHSSSLPKNTGNKSLNDQRFYGSPSSTNSHGSYSSNNSIAQHPRTLPPYISVQKPSEPASPATIATTISSHSTPSPSPSRNANISHNIPNSDFTLFDDAIMAAAQDLGGNVGKGRSAMDVSSTMADSSPALSHYATSGFPIIVPHDTSYSNYAASGIYNGYPSNATAADSSAGVYAMEQSQQMTQGQQQNGKYLRPSPFKSMSAANGHRHSDDVESIENVPALSPTSRDRHNGSSQIKSRQAQGSRPRSPLPSSAKPSYISTSSAYMQSAMPKLGRTYSDAVQDELYNPELLSSGESRPQQTNHNSSGNKHTNFQSASVKTENKHSFPHIFQEAQQQHQQDFSHVNSPNHQMGRDRSPFRHNSPFHHNYSQGMDQQNQLAMAYALREQMRKEAEASAAPKTISPRDSLLEYNEPENQHNQMNLFPPPHQNGRMLPPQDDALSNGSLNVSSQDGSDMDDFHSMATSRRASMANSSVSSHMEMPRFGYLQQQPSYDAVTNAPYFYNDPNTLSNALAVNDSIPYIKEEMDYNPIPRPADTSANSGTYTCTFSGCGQRFTTSTKLQKHRREAHRKSTPSGNSVSSAAAIASRNAQPGPHRCMRINPSTGKPCNTVFSRPYDLTRHEDTIHNSAKEKVRCEICNDEKTFSRPDALVRHRRVKHGIH